MNPMQQHYAQALRAQRQEQQQPNPLDAAYQNLRQIGMSHDQALATINQHMQQSQGGQVQPAVPARGDDHLTNNANLQDQGTGSVVWAQYDGYTPTE